MGIVRSCRRTTINASEVTRGSRLVLMSNISANGCALKMMMWKWRKRVMVRAEDVRDMNNGTGDNKIGS